MYKVLIPRNVEKKFMKLDKKVGWMAFALLEQLSINPYLGSLLSSEFHQLRSLKFQSSGVHYRIAYQVVEKKKEIQVIHVGTRENFYKELRRRVRDGIK